MPFEFIQIPANGTRNVARSFRPRGLEFAGSPETHAKAVRYEESGEVSKALLFLYYIGQIFN